MYIEYVIAGIFGGVVRGLTGYVKYLTSYKGVKFDWRYFSLMVGVSGMVGGIAGWIMNSVMQAEALNAMYAFLAGYAGGDFIENAFKIIFKKPTLFKIPEVLKESIK